MAIPEPYSYRVRAKLRKIPTRRLEEAYEALGASQATGIEIVEANRAYALSAIREILWERGKLPPEEEVMKKLISEEEAIGMLERLSMTPDEARRSLFGSEEERQTIMKAVQERVKREQNKWAPFGPREGPPLPRIFAGLRWPWRKQ